MTTPICYLCGKPNPDTRDHVPPRCLLADHGDNRLTLPAHRDCNTGFSRDEEYFRDLIGPAALEFQGGEGIYSATKRGWQRPQGSRRLKMMLKNAVPVQLQSSGGIYTGKAIGVRPNIERVTRVGFKIARGVIFHDTGARADPEAVQCVHIHSRDVSAERERELAKQNPFWLALSWDNAYHTNFTPAVAVRRAYTPISADPHLECVCFMLVMIYAESFVVTGSVQIPSPPEDLIMVGMPGITHEFEDARKGGAEKGRSE